MKSWEIGRIIKQSWRELDARGSFDAKLKNIERLQHDDFTGTISTTESLVEEEAVKVVELRHVVDEYNNLVEDGNIVKELNQQFVTVPDMERVSTARNKSSLAYYSCGCSAAYHYDCSCCCFGIFVTKHVLPCQGH